MRSRHERSFHIFYQLCAGADSRMEGKALNLSLTRTTNGDKKVTRHSVPKHHSWFQNDSSQNKVLKLFQVYFTFLKKKDILIPKK